jgi:hypothetical protein
MTPLDRCWLCDQRLLRDEATRVVPGIGLVVHSRCYESADQPAARRPPAWRPLATAAAPAGSRLN